MSKNMENDKIKYRLQYRLKYLFLQKAYERQRDEIMQSFGFEYDKSKIEFYNCLNFINYIDKNNKWTALESELTKRKIGIKL